MVINESEAPYMYCRDCKRLSPLVVIKGKKSCGVCGRMGLDRDSLPVVLLTRSEATLRKLPFLERDD